MTIAIQSETLKAQARYELIKIISVILNELNTDSEGLRSRKRKKSPHIDVKFTDYISYRRTMNILIPIRYALKNLSDIFSISPIFTYFV